MLNLVSKFFISVWVSFIVVLFGILLVCVEKVQSGMRLVVH